MYFRDCLFTPIKLLGIIVFAIIVYFLVNFDYHLGVSYCNYVNIPKNFSLTFMSPGFAIEICIILFVFEIAILAFIINKLKLLLQKNN